MRVTSLFAAAFALAITNVAAADEAQQSTVHLRIHTEDEIPNASAQVKGEDTAQDVPSQKHHHQRGHQQLERAATRSCRKIKDEWFRDQIASACHTTNRKGVHNFFYLLENGKYMRNCNCNDALGGLIWKDESGKEHTPGYVSGISLDFRCYSKKMPSATDSWRTAIAPFNRDEIKCIPTDFTITPM